MSPNISRRTVLKGAAGLAAAPLLGFTGTPRRGPVPADPFTLGVASGDPSPDGAVIWTRLAPRPLADDGLGGMPARTVEVQWEIAADEAFTRPLQRGHTVAAPEDAHSVHVELAGLPPAGEYFYRFRAEGYLSPVGRTRTTPAPDALNATLTMCAASCSNYQHGWFTAYRHLAEEHPDVVVHLGDYLYEYAAGGERVRDHAGPETVTLAHYRQRHAQYRTDPDLQAAHAAAPWLVVFDDHELADNWAGDIPKTPDAGFPARRAAALQAYYENMPLRASAKARNGGMRLYRRVEWGALATFHMLDTRQYRSDQACGDRYRSDCAERFDPHRTLLGADQQRWLLDGFAQSGARWDLLAQQVFFAPLELAAGPARGVNPDAWDGYVAERDRVITGIADSAVRNGVVLTGDVHAHWAAEIRRHPEDPLSAPVATELVTTSITSGGDGSDTRADVEAILPENPHIRYFSNRRGYLRATVTPDELRADFRTVPFVTRPGAPVTTAASFVIPDRLPQLL